MTYALYLAVFLGGPLLALVALTWRARRRLRGPLPWAALLAHVLVAVVYTTPWDNYLVANGVWSYDPQRVLGVVWGWVPVEEYAFFVLQTLMTGLWLLWLRRADLPRSPWRWRPWRPALWTALLIAAVWAASVVLLWSNWPPGVYLGLELGWFLPPIILQVLVGGDVLWKYRRLVALALLPPIIYLTATDALAIGAGVWAISPQHSLGVYIVGVLPLEELVFFALTNTLIVFGMTLVLEIGERLWKAA
jgi:lycopene cyclase domain-containing protein